ncbi:MAG TPA: hypothetical protein VLJ57_01165 [Burkholderiaceae bacterium]|nr:hypothetical protein [Burkholderiaceae bacterium]
MNKLWIAPVLFAACGIALAKLPPVSDEAKAKAAEAAAKTAWTGKVDNYLLCKSQDKVAAAYQKTAKAAGKEIKPPKETPACGDPGPFAYTPPDAKPAEAAGAHSPPGTAASPPSTKTPAAEMAPAKKS